MKPSIVLFVLMTLFGLFFILGGLGQVSSASHSTGEVVIPLLFGGVFIICGIMPLIMMPSMLELDGTVLTIQKRKLFPVTRSMDLNTVVRLGYGFGTGRNTYTICFYDKDNHELELDLNGYDTKAKLALLPALQEVCNRPGIQKNEEDITRVLKGWYK